MAKEKGIIGRAEMIEFVDYNLTVQAKVDTGADRNALHATRIKLENNDGKDVLTCKILKGPTVKFYDFSTVKVKSSNGVTQNRYKVKLKVKVFGKAYLTSFSLTDRQKMKYPILLGKNFLRNRFLVDVSLKNIGTN